MQNDVRGLNEEEARAWRSLLRTQADLVANLDRELANNHDLGLPDYEVLSQLAASPESSVRMTELARSVLLSPSGLTRRLDGLVKSGYVERRPCPSDGRGLLAVLTEKGRSKVDEMTPTHVIGVHRHFVDRITPEQLSDLIEIFSALNSATIDSESAGQPTIDTRDAVLQQQQREPANA